MGGLTSATDPGAAERVTEQRRKNTNIQETRRQGQHADQRERDPGGAAAIRAIRPLGEAMKAMKGFMTQPPRSLST